MATLADFDLPIPPGSRVLFSGGKLNGTVATALKVRERSGKWPECLQVQLDVGRDGGKPALSESSTNPPRKRRIAHRLEEVSDENAAASGWARGLRLPDYALDVAPPAIVPARLPAAVARQPRARQPVLPTLFVPGFPKSATTWLYTCIAEAFAPRRAGCGSDAWGWNVSACPHTFLLTPLTATRWQRNDLVLEVIRLAEQTREEQQSWAAGACWAHRPMVSRLRRPLLRLLLRRAGFVDPDGLVDSCLQGFPMVGVLPPCEGASTPHAFPSPELSVAELREDRWHHNQDVIARIKPMPYQEDVLPQVWQDAEQGFMSTPRLLKDEDLHSKSFTRRIPVREERSKGWTTRVVDHETESMMNPATQPVDKLQFDGLDMLVAILLFFLRADVMPRMWKRDISKAFRRIPVFQGHLDLSWTIWMHEGLLYIAQHRGMPFGTISAVYAWHRIGHALLCMILVIFLAPVARYVDDFFGASKEGITWTGGRILSVLSKLLGFDSDDAKDADDAIRMTVLGAELAIKWPYRSVSSKVDSVKASRWVDDLVAMVKRGVCSMELAAKYAGRLSFAVVVSGNRVGRAYIRPFHAQANAPLAGSTMSSALIFAALWFRHYLEVRPPANRESKRERRQVISWQDAAGESRWVAAVTCLEGSYFWTRVQTPQWLWDQLLPRGDAQIGFQELLGVVLALGTFGSQLSGSLWVSFIDNDGVMHALLNGGGRSPEINSVIGRLWLHLAEADIDLHAARVESAANIADGPTRDYFDNLAAINARFVNPILPDWMHSIWSMPAFE